MNNADNVEQLVKTAAEGDKKAFERLYALSYRAVYFTCISFLKNEQDALDLAQDVYLTAFEQLNSLNEPDKFMAWVARIAANKSMNYLKKKKPELVKDEEIENSVLEENENFLPEEYAASQEKRQLVLNIMKTSLSDTLYQTVILYYFDGLTAAEIAELMGCPVGTVTYRLSAARGKIKAGVEQYEKKSGDKLYSVAALPFLTSLLVAEVQNMYVPYAAPAFLEAAGKGVKAILKAAKFKIAVGAAATAVVAGTAAAIVLNVRKEENNPRDDREIVSEVTADNSDDGLKNTGADEAEKSEAYSKENSTEEEKLGPSYEIFTEDGSTKVTVTLPERYEPYEESDGKSLNTWAKGGKIEGKQKHYFDVQFEKYTAEHSAEEWYKYYDNACETNEMSLIEADDGTEWYCVNQKTKYKNNVWRLVNFYRDLPNCDSDCCIHVHVQYSGGDCDFEPEDFTDFLCEPYLKIE